METWKKGVSYYISKGSVAIWIGICEKTKTSTIVKGKLKIRSQWLH